MDLLLSSACCRRSTRCSSPPAAYHPFTPLPNCPLQRSYDLLSTSLVCCPFSCAVDLTSARSAYTHLPAAEQLIPCATDSCPNENRAGERRADTRISVVVAVASRLSTTAATAAAGCLSTPSASTTFSSSFRRHVVSFHDVVSLVSRVFSHQPPERSVPHHHRLPDAVPGAEQPQVHQPVLLQQALPQHLPRLLRLLLLQSLFPLPFQPLQVALPHHQPRLHLRLRRRRLLPLPLHVSALSSHGCEGG